jgi:hypothetical protein
MMAPRIFSLAAEAAVTARKVLRFMVKRVAEKGCGLWIVDRGQEEAIMQACS